MLLSLKLFFIYPQNYNNNKNESTQNMNLTDDGILYVHIITINYEKWKISSIMMMSNHEETEVMLRIN